MEIIRNGLYDAVSRKRTTRRRSPLSERDVDAVLADLSAEPVAAASIGQVYKSFLPDYGPIAIKVKRPGIEDVVRRDAQLLKKLARWVETLPGSLVATGRGNSRRDAALVRTKLVASVDEFMSRVFEELDYSNEASNMELFADLYCNRRKRGIWNRNKVKVVVPQLLPDLCNDDMIVMEWIDGTKLTDFETGDDAALAENLALIETGIDCTLSQLLDTGTLHADPHLGNLLKVVLNGDDDDVGSDDTERKSNRRKGKRQVELGYLDFGIVSNVPSSVRDALVCAVVQLVFARDVDAVTDMFGELQLLPQHVLQDPDKRAALAEALDDTFQKVLVYPEVVDDTDDADAPAATAVPMLRFDNLLGSLSLLVTRFEFQLPPYFLNNARALGTLEGIARELDPSFNVLRVLYPYALNRLLTNPSGSDVVERTLLNLIRSPDTGEYDRRRIAKILQDSSTMTGYSRRRVVYDIAKTRGGRRLIRKVAFAKFRSRFFPGREATSGRSEGEQHQHLLDSKTSKKSIFLRL